MSLPALRSSMNAMNARLVALTAQVKKLEAQNFQLVAGALKLTQSSASIPVSVLLEALMLAETKLAPEDIQMPFRSLFLRLSEKADGAAAAAAKAVASLEPRIAAAETVVAAQEPRLAGAEALAAAHEPRLAVAEAVVAAHEPRLAAAEASVATFAASDAAQEARLAAEEAKSAAQEARDAAQDASVAASVESATTPLKAELEALKKGHRSALEIATHSADAYDGASLEAGALWAAVSADSAKLVRLVGSSAPVYGFPVAPAPGALHRFLNDTAGDASFGPVPYDEAYTQIVVTLVDVLQGDGSFFQQEVQQEVPGVKRVVPEAVFVMAPGEAYTFAEKDGAWAFVPGF